MFQGVTYPVYSMLAVRKIIFLKIYNRWRRAVFEKKDFIPTDVTGTWDGKYKGVDAPAGAYVYILLNWNAQQISGLHNRVVLVS